MARGLQKGFLGSTPGNMAFLQRQVHERRCQEIERLEEREDHQLEVLCDALKDHNESNETSPVNITVNINVTPDQVSQISPKRLEELIGIAVERAKKLSN